MNQAFIFSNGLPFDVAVDDRFVYWTDPFNPFNRIGRANLDGTGVNLSFISGGPGVQDVAVDETSIYWTQVVSGGTIGRANLNATDVDLSFISGAGPARGIWVSLVPEPTTGLLVLTGLLLLTLRQRRA